MKPHSRVLVVGGVGAAFLAFLVFQLSAWGLWQCPAANTCQQPNQNQCWGTCWPDHVKNCLTLSNKFYWGNVVHTLMDNGTYTTYKTQPVDCYLWTSCQLGQVRPQMQCILDGSDMYCRNGAWGQACQSCDTGVGSVVKAVDFICYNGS